jgi:NADH-quinone oxidoreductase subunit G
MPKLIIDERTIEVEPGTKVIEAAERLGIMIPRFCYHPALGSVGACRVCAVKFLQGPFKGLQMSCMVDARDGMVVSTTDAEALDFRRNVIEWLMLHHPHDCPVCDEGGHCLLQEMTVAGGHGLRRFRGRKRTHRDQDLGPLVQHEMNRCIQCYRCSRFYQEFAGYRDLGVMGIGNRVYFGRRRSGPLQSPFSGNLTDICPTGVYTDKPSRYKGRRWDYERTPTVCIHCSLGCHLMVNARYREVVRLEAHFSDAVNGYFICDRGRYGFPYTNLAERPRRATLGQETVDCAAALQAAARKLQTVEASAVACAASTRSSLETLAAVEHLSRVNGWREPAFWLDGEAGGRVRTAVRRLAPELAVSLRALERSDFILAVAADPLNEAPMLALALRQAARRDARVVVMDPRPIELPCAFEHLRLGRGESAAALDGLLRRIAPSAEAEKTPVRGDDLPREAQSSVARLADDLNHSRRPVIVCGTDAADDVAPELAADLAWALNSEVRRCGLFYVLPGANAFGAALVSGPRAAFTDLLTGIEQGAVKALVLVECDPFEQFADRRRLERALERLEHLVVLDFLDTAAVRRADVFLPTTTVFETGGFFVSQEGRLQRAQKGLPGALPVALAGGGSHPPRRYGTGLPGAEPAPAWQLLMELGRGGSIELQTMPTELRERLAEILALPAGDRLETLPAEGLPNAAADASRNRVVRGAVESRPSSRPSGTLELLAVEWTFGTEELSGRSAHLQALEAEPCLFLHPEDAARLGLVNGSRIELGLDGVTLELSLRVVENMGAGVAVIPRHRRLGWQHVGAVRTVISDERIRQWQPGGELPSKRSGPSGGSGE